MSEQNSGREGAVHISDADFQKEVLEASVPVVVDFWAPWCPPCRRLSPVLDKVAKDYQGKLVVAKINIDENQARADELGISSIPALLYFKDGKLLSKSVGFASEQDLRRTFDQLLQPDQKKS
jgi:thioredoxin 1